MHRWFFAIALLGLLTGGVRDLWDDWVERTQLPPLYTEVSVSVADRHGHILHAFPVEDGRWRLPVRIEQVDPSLTQMLIEYEDRRFHQHTGVDVYALLRAGWQRIRYGRFVSGGSTLTMQVARLVENSGTGQISGKLRQMRVAWALERRYSKSEILELYFTHAPYGGPIEGVRTASLAWFGKEPKRLTPDEAALLVALPQSPSTRRPDRFPENAVNARARVLTRVGKASDGERLPRVLRSLPQHAPHQAHHLLHQFPSQESHATTLDASLQTKMEALAARSLFSTANGVNAALMVADHTTGEILAAVGSADFSAVSDRQGFVDMTRAARSPGSTLKPLIYGLAFDLALAHPRTLFHDAPVQFGRYAPQNFDGAFRGDITAADALRQSLNIPPVQLTNAFGPARLIHALRTSGADPQFRGKPGLAVALGGLGLTLKDVVQLYASLANAGVQVPLQVSRPLMEEEPKRILSARSAWYVLDVLRSIPAPDGFSDGLAYKTGTSYGHRDAWAVGFDGKHVVGVWMGRPDGTPVPGAFGGTLAAPVLFSAFDLIAPERTPLPAPPKDALLLPNAELPRPLQRFGGRNAAKQSGEPVVSFPPDGAVIEGDVLALKIRGGKLPLTLLANGSLAMQGVRTRNVLLNDQTPGHTRVSVIDALGQSVSVSVEMR